MTQCHQYHDISAHSTSLPSLREIDASSEQTTKLDFKNICVTWLVTEMTARKYLRKILLTIFLIIENLEVLLVTFLESVLNIFADILRRLFSVIENFRIKIQFS